MRRFQPMRRTPVLRRVAALCRFAHTQPLHAHRGMMTINDRSEGMDKWPVRSADAAKPRMWTRANRRVLLMLHTASRRPRRVGDGWRG
jgi:hypothetical protein